MPEMNIEGFSMEVTNATREVPLRMQKTVMDYVEALYFNQDRPTIVLIQAYALGLLEKGFTFAKPNNVTDVIIKVLKKYPLSGCN